VLKFMPSVKKMFMKILPQFLLRKVGSLATV